MNEDKETTSSLHELTCAEVCSVYVVLSQEIRTSLSAICRSVLQQPRTREEVRMKSIAEEYLILIQVS